MTNRDIEKILKRSKDYRESLIKLHNGERICHVDDGITGLPGDDREIFAKEISVLEASKKLQNSSIDGVFKDNTFCKGTCYTLKLNNNKEELTLPKRIVDIHCNDKILAKIKKQS